MSTRDGKPYKSQAEHQAEIDAYYWKMRATREASSDPLEVVETIITMTRTLRAMEWRYQRSVDPVWARASWRNHRRLYGKSRKRVHLFEMAALAEDMRARGQTAP